LKDEVISIEAYLIAEPIEINVFFFDQMLEFYRSKSNISWKTSMPKIHMYKTS
jgi:hypothetical protein